MTFLSFSPAGTSDSGKTRVWDVVSGGLTLGQIKWYAPWRRYVFAPCQGSVYDSACLFELFEFCGAKTKEHKEKNGWSVLLSLCAS